MCFSKPKLPKPPPPPPMPTRDQAAVRAENAGKDRRNRRGYESTIMTGPLGVSSAASAGAYSRLDPGLYANNGSWRI
jgi:hypothetical protein